MVSGNRVCPRFVGQLTTFHHMHIFANLQYLRVTESNSGVAICRRTDRAVSGAMAAQSHFEDERVFVAESVFYVENVCFQARSTFYDHKCLDFSGQIFLSFLFLLWWLLAHSQRQRSMLKDIGKNPSPASDR